MSHGEAIADRHGLNAVKGDEGYHEYYHKDFPQIKILVKEPPNFGIVFYLLKKLTEMRMDLDPNHPFNDKNLRK